jgi:hypothetical protein
VNRQAEAYKNKTNELARASRRRRAVHQTPEAGCSPASGPAPYSGRLVEGLIDMVDGKLRGAQLPLLADRPPTAYRAATANGSLVVCDKHLDLLRATETAVLTGEQFPADLCDMCLEGHEL